MKQTPESIEDFKSMTLKDLRKWMGEKDDAEILEMPQMIFDAWAEAITERRLQGER